jgi:peptidoglycan-associated lipoprotein
MATIHFDYDAADIRGDARGAGRKADPARERRVQIRISGHADERGSDQYNDALGQRARGRETLLDRQRDRRRPDRHCSYESSAWP